MVYLCTIDARKFKDAKLLNEALSNVSKFRREKYDAYRNEEVKLQSIAASYLIDRCLKEYNLREKDMEYLLGKAGKPYFKNHEDIHFSISHSKNIAMVAFSDKEVGCDVQVVRNAPEELYDLVLSDEEKKVLEKIKDEKTKSEQFFKYWVIKEAIIKRDGTGLRDSLTNVHDEHAYLDKKALMDDDEIYFISVNTGNKEEIITISI